MSKNQNEQRSEIGKNTSIVGVIVNFFLARGKIIFGAISGAISVVADGLNNLTDCGSSVMSFVSFKLANKPADKEHPFGHQRIEYINILKI